MRSLIIGGNRSGKSARAERLIAAAAGSSEVLYVAPGLTSGDDDDFAERVATHQARRPAAWRTIETREVSSVLRENPDAFVLIDDLAAWLTATLDANLGWTGDRHAADAEIDDLVAALTEFRGTALLVSAEVGLGVVAPTTAGRQFTDILGALNSRLSELCDAAEFVVAGHAIALDGRPETVAHPALRDDAVARFGSSDARSSVSDRDAAPQRPPRPDLSAGPLAGAAGVASTSASASASTPNPDTSGAPSLDSNTSEEDFPGLGDAAAYDTPGKFGKVAQPDRTIAGQALEYQATLTKPAGSLGRLEDLGVWYSACRGNVPPPPLAHTSVVVFAGDHGVAAHGVSAFPSEVTTQMVDNILSGGAGVSVLARLYNATVKVADMAVEGSTPEHTRRHKIRRSSGSLDREDALTEEETLAAIAAGRRIADEEIDAGADLLIAGDLGIGNTTPATVLIGTITGMEPVAIVGRGTGIDDGGWMRKAAAVRDGMFRSRDVSRKPVELLQRVGGADLAAMAGFLAQAALRKTPCILDGVVVTSAALVADLLAPGARGWWQAGHRSPEPAHTTGLTYLGLEPIIEGNLRLGEGSGAVTALPVLQGAVAVIREMATFDDAGVSGKSEIASD